MSTLNLEAYNTSLKEVYLPRLTLLAATFTTILKLIEAETADNFDLETLRAKWLVELAPGHYVSTIWEDEEYPEGVAPRRTPADMWLRKQAGRLTLTPETIKASKDPDAAYVKATDKQTVDVARQLGEDRARQLTGFGNGIVVTCGTTGTASTTINLAADTPAALLNWLRTVNPVVDIGTTSNYTSKAAGVRIIAVDKVNKTVTITGSAITTGSTNVITIVGSGGNRADGRTREMTSLQNICDDTSELCSIDPTDPGNDKWSATVADASGQAITYSRFTGWTEQVRTHGGITPDTAVSTPGAFREAVAQLSPQLRFEMKDQKLMEIGVEALNIDGTSLTKDDNVHDGQLFLLNRGHEDGIRYVTDGTGVESVTDGWELSRSSRKDELELMVRCYGEYGTRRRSLHGRVDNVKEAA